MEKSEMYMLRAIQLAKLAKGMVHPNPLVGCVIADKNGIIGEGWHRSFGGHHAEIEAIKSIPDTSKLADCTMYVTLEPCCHFGKTPPCTQNIIQSGIKNIVIANRDPNPLVAEKGIEKLLQSGIKVEIGLCNLKAAQLNKSYFDSFRLNRPSVMLKLAVSPDGFISSTSNPKKWISNSLSRQLVHKYRAQSDGVLIGTNTALEDNPHLNIRDWVGKNPLRIVLDKTLRIPPNYHIFDAKAKTLIYNGKKSETIANIEYVKPMNWDMKSILEDLRNRNVMQLLVEGGRAVIDTFLEESLWDEYHIFTGNWLAEAGIKAPNFEGSYDKQFFLKGDILKIYSKNAEIKKSII